MKARYFSAAFILTLIMILAGSGQSFAQGRVLRLSVTDTQNQPVRRVTLGIRGGSTGTETTRQGETEIPLQGKPKPGSWVELVIVPNQSGEVDWVFIDPWDGKVRIPAFDDPLDFVPIVLAERANRALLENPRALEAIAQSIIEELAPQSTDDEITDERRQRVLQEHAERFGLTAGEIDEALRAWAERAEDAYEKGIAELYLENYPDAETYLEKSLEEQTEKMVDTARFLGMARYAQGKYQQAADAYRQADFLRPNDGDILNYLALCLDYSAKYEEALPLYQRSLKITQRAYGDEHPDVAIRLNNLGALYYAQGKYDDALPLYKRALEIHQQAFGENHPDVAIRLNNLAELYTAQGQYADALPLYKQALEIKQQAFGENHPSVATSLNNLAGLYYAQGNYADALPLFQRTLAIFEGFLGQDHPNVATVIENLIIVYEKRGKSDEALQLYKKQLAYQERKLGSDSPEFAQRLNGVAVSFYKDGHYDQALPLYERALSIQRKVLKPDDSAIAITLHNLASLYAKQGKYNEAEDHFKGSLAISEKQENGVNTLVARSLNNWAAMELNQGKGADAQVKFERALAIYEKLETVNWQVAETLSHLAAIYKAQEKYTQAETHLKRAIGIWFLEGHADVTKGVENYVDLLRKMGREDEAKEMEGLLEATETEAHPESEQ